MVPAHRACKYGKLSRSFYARPTLEVAHDLIGKYLVYVSPRGRLSARLVEVEAYIGEDDPACHASRGLTERTRPMFGPPGRTYIYFVYGMYYCLNLVTEPEGHPAAVLVRAAEPCEGIDHLLVPGRGRRDAVDILAGPGKLCRAFGLTREQNDLDLTGDTIYVEDRHMSVGHIRWSRRVGIRVGTDRPWRFYDAESPAVTRSR